MHWQCKEGQALAVTTVLCNSLDEMISQADDLLYNAKQSGRNCVVISLEI